MVLQLSHVNLLYVASIRQVWKIKLKWCILKCTDKSSPNKETMYDTVTFQEMAPGPTFGASELWRKGPTWTLRCLHRNHPSGHVLDSDFLWWKILSSIKTAKIGEERGPHLRPQLKRDLDKKTMNMFEGTHSTIIVKQRDPHETLALQPNHTYIFFLPAKLGSNSDPSSI